MTLTREAMLLRGLDRDTMVGLEIGPFFSPIAPKAQGWRTYVVDFTSGEELREKARTHTAEVIRANAHLVEDVDVITTGQNLQEPLLALRPEGFDYLIASHAFEHVPDLIGFLNQCEQFIAPGGVMSLAMPDLRFCFDYFRRPTMTDDLLLAHREGRKRHTAETLFQAQAYQGWLKGAAAWSREETAPVDLVCTIEHAYAWYVDELAADQVSAAYIDAHSWVFTPANFSLVILELNVLGLISFRIRGSLEDGQGSEFFAQLEPGRVELDTAGVHAERQRLVNQMVIEQASRQRGPDAAPAAVSAAPEPIAAPEPTAPLPPPGRSATLPLEEGLTTLVLPAGLSARSVAALRTWLDVVVDLSSAEQSHHQNGVVSAQS